MGFAIAGAVALTGIIASQSSQNATSAETNAASQANNTQTGQYNQTRQDWAPWRAAGAGALNELTGGMPNLNRPFSMADFQADPGYKFRMDQGNKAIERSAAARGGLDSGDTLKALSNYGQDSASAEYGKAFDRYNINNTNTFNRLSSIAGLGQTATANVTNAGTNAANNISSNQTGAGNAIAAGQIAGANTINSAVGTGMNTWMQQQYLNKFGNNPSSGYQFSPSSGGNGYGVGSNNGGAVNFNGPNPYAN